MAGGRARSGANKVTCEDCFFRRRNLCALDLDEPCPTFRPDTPAGLVPPRQPSLLMRSAPVAAGNGAMRSAPLAAGDRPA